MSLTHSLEPDRYEDLASLSQSLLSVVFLAIAIQAGNLNPSVSISGNARN